MTNTTATAVNAGTRWTAQDVADLRDLRAINASNDEIAYIMGRTVEAVQTAKRDIDERERTSQMVTDRGVAKGKASHTPITYGEVCASCFVTKPVATNVCESCA